MNNRVAETSTVSQESTQEIAERLAEPLYALMDQERELHCYLLVLQRARELQHPSEYLEWRVRGKLHETINIRGDIMKMAEAC